ncbi:MAG TPA: MFS transporter [Pyrinomonadaceae bacterium]|jgi:DHA3 family tetracycline resistance protein-like MFS transporter
MTLFKALTVRSFALLWSGQQLSALGDSIYRVALAWWVLEKTGSATAMSTIFIFASAPMLIFLLIGGVAVDRYPRARVMLLSDVVRGLLIGIVAVLAFTHRLEVWHIYLVSLLFGIAGAFFGPAYRAIVPEILPRELLPSANGMMTMSLQLADIAGPALGAFVVSKSGSPTAFTIDSLSFLISILCLAPLVRLALSPQAPQERKSVLHDFREGVEVVRKSSWLWITIVIASLGNITLSAPLAIALPFLVKNHLHGGVGSLGLIYSTISAGSIVGTILGTVWLERTSGLRARGLFAYGLWIAGGMLIVVFGLPVTIYAVAAAAFMVGAAFIVPTLIFMTTLQELIPGKVLGRVMSIVTVGSVALVPVGSGLVGWATDHVGAPTIFILSGVLTASLAALALMHPVIRNLDRAASTDSFIRSA